MIMPIAPELLRALEQSGYLGDPDFILRSGKRDRLSSMLLFENHGSVTRE
jgi:undecaprenyl pyrophosphate synthase